MEHNLGPLCKLRDWITISPDDYNFVQLSANPNAIHLLEQNPEKIVWSNLSTNPKAIHLLERFPEKIHWYYL